MLIQPELVLWEGVSGQEVPDEGQGSVLPSAPGCWLCMICKEASISSAHFTDVETEARRVVQLARKQPRGAGDPSAQHQPGFKERPSVKGDMNKAVILVLFYLVAIRNVPREIPGQKGTS